MGLISLLVKDENLIRLATTDILSRDVWLTETREYLTKTYKELCCMYCAGQLFVFADDGMETSSEHVRVYPADSYVAGNSVADITHMRGAVIIEYHKEKTYGRVGTDRPIFVSRRSSENTALRA